MDRSAKVGISKPTRLSFFQLTNVPRATLTTAPIAYPRARTQAAALHERKRYRPRSTQGRCAGVSACIGNPAPDRFPRLLSSYQKKREIKRASIRTAAPVPFASRVLHPRRSFDTSLFKKIIKREVLCRTLRVCVTSACVEGGRTLCGCPP